MSQQQEQEMIGSEAGKKKIDPKKLEKQLKFEQKQAALAQQKLQQEQKPKKAEKVEKPKVEDEPLPQLDFKDGIEFKQNLSKMREKYEPQWVEAHWQQYWNENQFFHPQAEQAQQSDKKFTILVPPPNVTGSLHIGHGLTFAIQDTLVRYKRMNGFMTQYTPGTDHAGIATQTVVEKMIWKNEKKTRYDYGREAFLEKVWDWKKSYGDRILMQAQKLGASVDWDRVYFTMDSNLTTAVKEAFVRLHEKKLIYRSNRLVNWSCKMKTALSDIEVEYVDVTQPTKFKIPNHDGEYTFGLLQSFSYKVKDSDEEVVIATTRLETMLGDVAVAVNSKDPRYTHLVGKKLIHPFISDRDITIITDDILVDMNFGSGAVKITPGHDPNDFECGIRNNLPQINIFNDDGEINENGGRFKGMKRYDVRNLLTEELKKLGQYKGEVSNPYRLGFCSRSKDVIEPMMRPQWYVSCKEMSEKMCNQVKNKELLIIPQEHEKTWFQWIGGIKDWCISRQIWWGHQCPAYQVSFQGEDIMERENRWIIARNKEEAMEKAIQKFEKKQDEIILTQDQDVLDTWFSSALLPFSVYGWPNEENPDFKAFFPNSILETGADILFFWVARMVLMSELLLEQLPFKTVYLHPMIRDAQGRKMSKSLGNVIDPLEIINGCTLKALTDKILEGNLPQTEIEKSMKEKESEFPNGIQECGSDALRFGLLCYLTQNRSINLDIKRIVGYRNFCNKIWQSFKFVTQKFDNFTYNFDQIDFNKVNLLNKWILVKLNKTINLIREGFDNFNLADPANGFHQFWIHDFCDVYIEGTKFIFQDNDKNQVEETLNILFHVIETGLRLLHPMMVFLTEELYQKLPDFKGKAKSICIAQYPQAKNEWICEETIKDFEQIQQIVAKVRSLNQSVNLPNNVRPQMFLISQNIDIKKQDIVLKGLSKASEIQYQQDDQNIPKGCIIGNVNDYKIYINVRDHIKVDDEIKKLSKKLTDIEKQIQSQQKKMTIKDYDTKTPEDIKQQNQQKLDQYIQDQKTLEQQVNDLKNL